MRSLPATVERRSCYHVPVLTTSERDATMGKSPTDERARAIWPFVALLISAFCAGWFGNGLLSQAPTSDPPLRGGGQGERGAPASQDANAPVLHGRAPDVGPQGAAQPEPPPQTTPPPHMRTPLSTAVQVLEEAEGAEAGGLRIRVQDASGAPLDGIGVTARFYGSTPTGHEMSSDPMGSPRSRSGGRTLADRVLVDRRESPLQCRRVRGIHH